LSDSFNFQKKHLLKLPSIKFRVILQLGSIYNTDMDPPPHDMVTQQRLFAQTDVGLQLCNWTSINIYIGACFITKQ